MFKRINKLLAGFTVSAALLVCWSATSIAANTSTDAAAEAKAREYFTNIELIDQNGQRLAFYDDVLKGNIVVISVIFTNCQGACPLMTRNLTMIRDMLPTNVRDEIQFISISLDPVRDTPAAMKEFAQTHDADQERWLWLTGQPDNVNLISKKLGTYTDELEAECAAKRCRGATADARRGKWSTVTSATGP